MKAFSPLFLKLRTIVFSCISSLSFLWIILLCLDVFLQWEVSGKTERSFLIVFLFVNVITIIMLPILLLREFRPWLDAARFLFLSVCHIGSAGSFAFWNPKIQCPNNTPDEEGVCKLLNFYLLLASWLIPLLLVAYTSGLAFVVFRHRPPGIEKGDREASLHSDHEHPRNGDRVTSMPSVTLPPLALRRDSTQPSLSTCGGELEKPEKSRLSTSTRSAGRLSKRLPDFYFS